MSLRRSSHLRAAHLREPRLLLPPGGGGEYPGYPKPQADRPVTYEDLAREREIQRLQHQLDQTQAELRQRRERASLDEATSGTMTLADERGDPHAGPL